MSSFFRINKHDGKGVIEVSAKTLSTLLAKPLTIGRLFRDLDYENSLEIELRTGPATICRAPPRALPQPSQQMLTLPQPKLPTQDYLAKVQIKFLLPADVRCRGHSEAHVKETIKDVVRGFSTRELGFSFDPYEVRALLGRMEVGDVTAMADVDVISVSPYLLLTSENVEA